MRCNYIHYMMLNFVTSSLHPGCNGCNYMRLHDHYMQNKMLKLGWEAWAQAQCRQSPPAVTSESHTDSDDGSHLWYRSSSGILTPWAHLSTSIPVYMEIIYCVHHEFRVYDATVLVTVELRMKFKDSEIGYLRLSLRLRVRIIVTVCGDILLAKSISPYIWR